MAAPRIRVASYNLQKCVGLDLQRRPERSLQVINALEANVVVLQEADKRLAPRPTALPHDMVEAAGWHILPFGAPGGSLGWHGNAMLARRDVKVSATSHLTLPGLEPRGAIRADLTTSIGPIRVIGVHLGLIRRYRLLQLAAIRKALLSMPAMPTILAGDFNEWGHGAELEASIEGLTLARTPPSFPTARPVARLDRFMLSQTLTTAATGTYTDRPARIASDHLPIWADITEA